MKPSSSSALAFVGLSLLLLLAGCTTSRATELREQVRIRRGASWAERWKSAQEKSDLWRYRLELCFAAREGAETRPIPLADVEQACSADVRTMEGVDTRDEKAELLASVWAEEVLQDARLTTLFTCRGAQTAGTNAQTWLSCAERQLTAHEWPQAKRALLAAFEHGSPAQQCAVVQRLDQHSPNPAQDAAGLDVETLRRCRSKAAPGARPAAPVLTTATEAPRAPKDTEPFIDGLQLNADLMLGTQGVAGSASVGYGTSRYAISFTPALAYANASSSGPSSVTLSLGASARFYLHERAARELAAYLRPEVFVGNSSTTVGVTETSAIFLGLGGAVGGEYLFSSRFGVTLELGLRVVGTPSTGAMAVGTQAAVGVVLHQ
ncbi:MAG: hypothetical protein ACOZQL_02300 [Myxococcota bacterium]